MRVAEVRRVAARAPDEHATGGPIRLDPNIQRPRGSGERPGRAWQGPACRGVAMRGADRAHDALEVAQSMPLVGHVEHPLGVWQRRPVKVQRIERPVAVVRAPVSYTHLTLPTSDLV